MKEPRIGCERGRLQILHVIGGLGAGGAETVLFRLVTHAGSAQHRVICLGEPDWYSGRLEDEGISVEHLGIKSVLSGIIGVARLFWLVRRSGANVVQSWMYRANLLAGLFSRLARIPAVWGVHSASLEPLSWRARLWAYASGFVARWVPSAIIYCSRRSQEVHAGLGFAKAASYMIHNGYDADVFSPDENERQKVRQELGIAPDTFLIGLVGRWHAEKDIPCLLHALKILKECWVNDFQCALVGTGLNHSNESLAGLLSALGLEDEVTCLGRRADIVNMMRALDIHVLSSRSEAFPNVVAEAMLSGTPCIVTDVGDAAMMVGESGWVAPPGSPEALAAKIGQAYHMFRFSSEDWEARCAAARARIAGNYSLQQMANGYEQIWRLVSAAGVGSSSDFS